MHATATYLKVLSLLLQYPDEAYFKALPDIEAVVRRMPPGPRKTSLAAFISHLAAGDPLHVQQQYTALFDMRPATTLNVTYHLGGDGAKRARLLTRLQQAYKEAGLEKSSSELPDYLPLILEFIATVPQAKDAAVIQKSLAGIDTLAARLKPDAPIYAGLLAPLAAMFKDRSENRTAAAAG